MVFLPDDYEDLVGKRRRLYMSSTLSPSAIGAIIQAKYLPIRESLCHSFRAIKKTVDIQPLSISEEHDVAQLVQSYEVEAKYLYTGISSVLPTMNSTDYWDVLKPYHTELGMQVGHHHGFLPWCCFVGILVKVYRGGKNVFVLGLSGFKYRLQPLNDDVKYRLCLWVHFCHSLAGLPVVKTAIDWHKAWNTMRTLVNAPLFYPVDEYHFEWMVRAWFILTMRFHNVSRLDVSRFPACRFVRLFPDSGDWLRSLLRPYEKTLPFLQRIGLASDPPEVVSARFCLGTTEFILNQDVSKIRKNSHGLWRLRAEMRQNNGVQPHPENLLREAVKRGLI